MKSPTLVAVEPTSELLPFCDRRNCNLSGNVVLGLLVKNDIVSPFLKVLFGPSSQLLIVPVPVVLLKLTKTKDVGAPWCAPVGNAVPTDP